MLFSCHELIPLHVVMELSWRHGLNDFTMPFLINAMAQQSSTIAKLQADNEARNKREQSMKKDEDSTPILGKGRLMLTQGGPAAGAQSPMMTGAPPMGMAAGGQPYMNGLSGQATGYRGF